MEMSSYQCRINILDSKKFKEYTEDDIINSRSLAHINSIKTYDFSTLYTTIPHTKLKSRLKNLINTMFLLQKWKP